MLIEHPGPLFYLLNALEAAPELFDHLLRDLSDEEADFRPDPARFSRREVVAHLADWEPIFLERLQRTRDKEKPGLPDVDEGQLALDHNYAGANVQQQLRRFHEGRARLVAFTRELPLEAWSRECEHERAGRLTLEALVTLVPLHDAYHLRQIVQWRERWADNRR